MSHHVAVNPHRPHQHVSPAERHEQLVDQTSKWVAQTFFGTLLKQMRESPFKSQMFDGGRGGEMFSTLYDQQLADHMGRSAGRKLVKALVHKIEGANTYSAASKAYKSAKAAGQIQASATAHRSIP